MKVSIIMITIDRIDIVKETLERILNNTGYDDFELLVADNGSTDGVIDYIKSLNPTVHLIHGENKGVAYSLNRLIEKSTGELIVHVGNDILLPENWMRDMVLYHETIPETGICAIHVVEALPPITEMNGLKLRLTPRVFGCKSYRKERVKYKAYKEFSKYGLEDSDLSLRFYYKGLYNYYLPKMVGRHIGEDHLSDSEYRQMKWEELKKAEEPFNQSIKIYQQNDRSKY